MIRMTLHSVTVECETLSDALALLDRWARSGEIKLPPAPGPEPGKGNGKVDEAAKFWAQQVTPEFIKATAEALPRVPAPAKPTPRKARGTAEPKACAVCGDEFTAPSPRCVTCLRHRMKPGQKLADVRKIYEREQEEAKTAKAPTPARDRAAAKGLLARPPIRPNEPKKKCAACGDDARAAELDKAGRCRDCHPVGEPS